MKHNGGRTLIIEPKRAHGEKLASGVSNVDIHSPCIIVTNLCDAVEEIIRGGPLHRIIFNPAIAPHKGPYMGPTDFNRLYGEAILKFWGRTDMSHIFLHILSQLQPEILIPKPQFFTPLNILCDTDATNAEKDMELAAQPLQGVTVKTRRNILQKLNIDEKSHDWERQLGTHFAKISPRIGK